MFYKTILVILSDSETAPALMETAVALSRAHGAHLIGLHAETAQYVMLYAPMDIPNVEASIQLAEIAKKRADELEAMFKDRMSRDDVPNEWRRVSLTAGFSGHGVIDTARCVDLIICNQVDDNLSGPYRNDLEALIFESGRPVLFVPNKGDFTKSIDRVVIAWNGSREAARAASDALPFLLHAKSVEILSIDSEDDANISPDLAGTELASRLTRYSIPVTTRSITSFGKPFQTVISDHVEATGTDLLVMGAYTHSRLKERLFGGVTRTLMAQMRTLTLMSR